MSQNKPEQKFWRFLAPRMSDHWLVTRHEDREISPGVPDLHYGFYPDSSKYQTGWLELKATDAALSKRNLIHVEPSQHQYIGKWGRAIPIHFLIRVRDMVYLIPGAAHAQIPTADKETDFYLMGAARFHQDVIATSLPPLLKSIIRI